MTIRKAQDSSQTGALVNRLSDDLVLHVFSFLSPVMLGRVSALSKRFAAIASEDMLWYALLCHDLGETRLPTPAEHVSGRGEWRRRWLAWRRLEACGCETRNVNSELDDAPEVRLSPCQSPIPASPRLGYMFACSGAKLASSVRGRAGRRGASNGGPLDPAKTCN
jgi:hypothetical protein